MDTEIMLNNLLAELKDVILNSESFPNEQDIDHVDIKKAFAEFNKKYQSKRNRKFGITEATEFIDKYDLFGTIKKYLLRFEELGAELIITEGADATGKTSLDEELGIELHGVALENRSAIVFEKMFDMPKLAKIAVMDYNRNVIIALVFYMSVNLYALQVAENEIEKGHKYVVIDSSFIRTMASHMARPVVNGKKHGIEVNKEVADFIENKLNKKLIQTLKEAKSSLYYVFLYASAGVRDQQMHEREIRDVFDLNEEYAKIVSDFVKKDELLMKKAGVPTVSIMTVTPDEIKNKSESLSKLADNLVARTSNKSADIKKKAQILRDFISANE